MDDYYQLSGYSFELSGTLVSVDKLDKSMLKIGRMPENEYEIVVDKRIIDDMINGGTSMFANMGIKSEEELLNKKVIINEMPEFKIVGFTNNNSSSIYANKNIFINILNNMNKSSYGMGIYFSSQNEADANVKDYTLSLDDITITKGRLPQNDYEVIVNAINKEEMKLNKTIKLQVNGKELTVVGYYDSKSNKQDYLVNNNTVKYDVISKNNGFMIYPKNKSSVMNKFQNEYKLNIIDRYQKDK